MNFLRIFIAIALCLPVVVKANVISFIPGDSVESHVEKDEYKHYKISALAGQTVTGVLDQLSADADLYVRIGSKPTLKKYDCRPYRGDTRVEKCFLKLDKDSDIYILVHGHEASNYRLKVDVSN